MFDINDGGSDPHFDIGMRDPRGGGAPAQRPEVLAKQSCEGEYSVSLTVHVLTVRSPVFLSKII